MQPIRTIVLLLLVVVVLPVLLLPIRQLLLPRTVDQRLCSLGSFLDAAGVIKSSEHAYGLIGLLHLAKGSQGGIHASLGHNTKQTSWIGSNIKAIFSQEDSPMGVFSSATPNVLM